MVELVSKKSSAYDSGPETGPIIFGTPLMLLSGNLASCRRQTGFEATGAAQVVPQLQKGTFNYWLLVANGGTEKEPLL